MSPTQRPGLIGRPTIAARDRVRRVWVMGWCRARQVDVEPLRERVGLERDRSRHRSQGVLNRRQQLSSGVP